MKKSQTNRLKMYLAVQLVQEEFSTLISNVPALEKAVSSFTEFVEQVKITQLIQENDYTGYRERRKRLRSLMTERSILIGNAVFAFARETSNEVLANSVETYPTDYNKVSQPRALRLCCSVLENAQAQAASLADYGVDAAMIVDFETLINTFAATMEDSRYVETKSRNATEHLAKLFDIIDNLLRDVIDKLMFGFKLPNPHFFNRYFIAREVIEYGIRHRPKEEVPGEEGEGSQDSFNGLDPVENEIVSDGEVINKDQE